ncbi:universal stress protein [Pseudomonas aeruginosa]|uniref:universal stress protein n=1 Tax=Pseudomonas aeruginosa TaxID=287 RepID=UPI000E6A57CA|nr:universal stress protein [Pseudomonas aeruginosa]
MPHLLKDIAAFFDDSPAGLRILETAALLASAQEAHLIGITMERHRQDAPGQGFARGSANHEVIRQHQELDEARLSRIKQALASMALKYGIKTELRTVSTLEAGDDAALYAMYCDLLIVTRPPSPGTPAIWSPIDVLQRTGVPLLILPEQWQGVEIAKRIVVTWNESRQSRRALADALPLLINAENVQLLIVDAERHPSHETEEPGSALALYLSRHGVNVELNRIPSRGKTIVDTILSQASSYNADLLVFGAYSRPRITEALLGGVTRSLLEDAPLPLFTS